MQVLRLLDTFSMSEVHAAIKDVLRLGAVSFDAVKHLVLCRMEGRQPGWTWSCIPTCLGRE